MYKVYTIYIVECRKYSILYFLVLEYMGHPPIRAIVFSWRRQKFIKFDLRECLHAKFKAPL